MDTKQLYYIALTLLYRTRPYRALQWLERCASAEEAWLQINEPEKEACWQRALREGEWIDKHGIHVYTVADEDYPYRLRQCPDRPIVLYGKGNLHPSDGHIVSIVGTRRPTERGRELTEALVRDLHERLDHLTIVSGGAYGIDITAHRTAIRYGIPTIIIPAHGLDRIYPQQHRTEAVASLEHGGLLTEFVSGTEPLGAYFLQRNRIVAGLADAVVVVESRERGGSLATARMAVDYNRDLFAFPGRPQDENARGCNRLIRTQKAQLIECADDLMEAMEWSSRLRPAEPVQTRMVGLLSELSPLQQQLAELLQEAEDGMHINLLVMTTGRDYGEVSSELVMMEMEGLVKALPGGIYRLVH